jgi:hypothetical protein
MGFESEIQESTEHTAGHALAAVVCVRPHAGFAAKGEQGERPQSLPWLGAAEQLV